MELGALCIQYGPRISFFQVEMDNEFEEQACTLFWLSNKYNFSVLARPSPPREASPQGSSSALK